MRREFHVRFWEGGRVRFPSATRRNIYVRSERAGQRVMESITRFITQKLKLKVNEAKSAVARPQQRKLLGFSFTSGPDITVSARSRRNLWNGLSEESGTSRTGPRASASRRQWKSCPLYAGLAQLFRLLRNARGVDRSHSLGPVAAAGCSLAPVENTTAPPGSTSRKRGLDMGCKEHSRQRPRSLVPCPK
jgi:hypothetical protein